MGNNAKRVDKVRLTDEGYKLPVSGFTLSIIIIFSTPLVTSLLKDHAGLSELARIAINSIVFGAVIGAALIVSLPVWVKKNN